MPPWTDEMCRSKHGWNDHHHQSLFTISEEKSCGVKKGYGSWFIIAECYLEKEIKHKKKQTHTHTCSTNAFNISFPYKFVVSSSSFDSIDQLFMVLLKRSAQNDSSCYILLKSKKNRNIFNTKKKTIYEKILDWTGRKTKSKKKRFILNWLK